MVDDKDLLSRAHTEIARLKMLLAQALKRLEEGGGGGGGEHGGGSGDSGGGMFGSVDREEMTKMMEENHRLRQVIDRFYIAPTPSIIWLSPTHTITHPY